MSRKRNISYNELKRKKEILVNEFVRNYTHLFGLKISKILVFLLLIVVIVFTYSTGDCVSVITGGNKCANLIIEYVLHAYCVIVAIVTIKYLYSIYIKKTISLCDIQFYSYENYLISQNQIIQNQEEIEMYKKANIESLSNISVAEQEKTRMEGLYNSEINNIRDLLNRCKEKQKTFVETDPRPFCCKRQIILLNRLNKLGGKQKFFIETNPKLFCCKRHIDNLNRLNKYKEEERDLLEKLFKITLERDCKVNEYMNYIHKMNICIEIANKNIKILEELNSDLSKQQNEFVTYDTCVLSVNSVIKERHGHLISESQIQNLYNEIFILSRNL